MVLSDLIVQLYNRNKSYQKFRLNNIDIHDEPSRMHRSSPRSLQNFPDSKNSKIVKSDTDISDLIIECFDQDESYQKLYFKQLISQ